MKRSTLVIGPAKYGKAHHKVGFLDINGRVMECILYCGRRDLEIEKVAWESYPCPEIDELFEGNLRNLLKRHGFRTRDDLAATPDDLLKMFRFIGVTYLQTIRSLVPFREDLPLPSLIDPENDRDWLMELA